MAPDASHRFFYFNGEHSGLRMYDVYTSKTPRLIVISNKLPGNKNFGEGFIDACGPRFSNDVKYLSVSYPLQSDNDNINGEFCIGKFNAGFTDATFVRITDNTDTNRDRIGDLWLASGEGPVKSTAISSKHKVEIDKSLFTVTTGQESARVSFLSTVNYSGKLLNVNGQVIATYSGNAPWNVANLHAGAYIISLKAKGQSFTRKAYICR
jgi:hypothetical protein